MNPGTASGRLVKDLLWHFIVKADQHNCFRCGSKMTRENFSVEHKTPWLHSENPKDMFFDLDNVTFSHLNCNISSARKPNRKYNTARKRDDERNIRRQKSRNEIPKHIKQKIRRDQYLRTGN